MKNKLILSLILSIIINHTTNAIPTKTPEVGSALVLGTGLVTAVGIKTMYEHDQSNNIALGVVLTSLAGGCLAYCYLKPFTTQAKLEKARNIREMTIDYIQKTIEINNKEIGKNTSSDETVNPFKKYIDNKYSKEDYPEITFFKTYLNPLLSRTENAIELLESELKEPESIGLKLLNRLFSPRPNPLKKALEDEKTNCKLLLKELTDSVATVRSLKDFDYHLEQYNKNSHRKTKLPLLEEQTKYYENKNSYLSKLFANNAFVEQIMKFFLIFISSYISINNNETEHSAHI